MHEIILPWDLNTHLFLRRESQNLASNSGDFDVLFACFVTALMLINLPQAYKDYFYLFKTTKITFSHWTD